MRDFAEGSELGDEPAVQTIYITNDGRSAFVVFYPGLPSSPFSFAPFARDAITGQLLERQQASVISPRASGFTLYAEGRYALTCGDDWSAQASYRVNDDGTVTRIGPGIDGCYRPQSDPLGRFVFVQTNAPGPPPSSLDTYKINADDGTISKAAELQMNLSNCCTAWKISQTGRYFLISNSSIFNQSPGSFSVYSIDQHTGALTYKTSIATKWRVTQFETGSGSWR